MIQQTHLTACNLSRLGQSRSQVEQDLRLSRGVAAIFADSVLADHVAMRGGTVLHKAHLAPAARYSEDIDLVLVKAMDIDLLDQHLRCVLTPVLGQPTDSLIDNAWLAIRNVVRPSKILRTSYRFIPFGLRREEVIKVGQSQRGQVAVSAGQCGRRGVTTQNTHGSGDSLRYQVQFSDGKSFVRWYELERVSEKDETVFTLLNKRQFGRLTDLRRNLTHIQLTGKLANLVYSMD